MLLFSTRPKFNWLMLVFALGAVLAAPELRAAATYRSVRMFGVDYVDVRDFARRYALTPQWTKQAKAVRLTSQWTTLELTQHQVEATLNRLTIFLSEPIVARSGTLFLARTDAERLLGPIFGPWYGPASTPLRTVVIDPGHGGRDPGNQNRALRMNEEVYTLDVARRLARLLTAAGFRVVLTRTRDRNVELEDRTALANRVRADLFVSIHFNAFSDPAVSGVETFVMTPTGGRSTPKREQDTDMRETRFPGNASDYWNAVAGYQIHRALVAGTGAADRGLKRFRYSVLRTVKCPAVLVEAGFLSNTAEARKIATPAYRERIAAAIANGIKTHRGFRGAKT